MLEILARNPGRLVIQQEILRAVWGEGYQKETHYLRAIVRFTEHFLCVSFI
ncbi:MULTISPECIES: winged helix-turn-helix domain-containing protein [Dietzia]|uniref:winged helix-turn-helix domain-containing protein n=1 Tax=Dietzia TaxID=37914 RepID=UPI00337AED89